MVQKVFKAVVKTRYDTAANFKAKNRVLAEGEKATESDTLKSKTGDGKTTYNSLPYDKADVSLTFDSKPTSGSTNPVTSGGIYDAINNGITLSVEPSAGSSIWVEVPTENVYVGSTEPTNQNTIWLEISK